MRLIVRIIPLCWLLWLIPATHAAWTLVENRQPRATIVVSEDASPTEQWAAQEIQQFVLRWSLAQLPITHQPPSVSGRLIVLGTPDTQPLIADALAAGTIALSDELGEEGYILQTAPDRVFVAASQPQGVLYGTYAFLERLVEQITGLAPADLDFVVPIVDRITVPDVQVRERPFFSIRCTLGSESPDWLARHRVNMSGAEGVWDGTGVNDGLGTAFKYVDAPRFESYQDEPQEQRRARIAQLRRRFATLAQRGIRPYLFMYVTGEPTKAWIQNHPELLGPPVAYGGSRNLRDYRPICWTDPRVHALIRDLIQEIVRTYPNLAGLHLRSWGWETRAPQDPACAGEDAQEQLWKIYETITQAALEVRPDFRFYISGYNRSWLKDPEGTHLTRLPTDTILSQKWGYDGEPTPDPRISLDDLDRIHRAGAQLLVLSHDTEEVMPLWMVEGDLFVQGVRKYAFLPSLQGLGGFTIQGQRVGLGYLDKLLSARLIWDPHLDYERLLQNYLSTHFGAEAASPLLEALRIHSWTLSSFFRDYAYMLSVTGAYGRGSAGAATRFWALVGRRAVKDMLAIPDREIAEKARQRLAALLPQQQAAAHAAEIALQRAQPHDAADQRDLEDTVTLMRLWKSLFESRLQIAEALVQGFQGGTELEVQQRIDSAREYSRTLLEHLQQIHQFEPIFGYQDDYYRNSLVEAVQEEIDLLANWDVRTLLHPPAAEDAALAIQDVLNYPNPMGKEGTTFFYHLTRDAAQVTLSVYTATGRLVWRLTDAPTGRGDHQIDWDGRDAAGRWLANGAYLYRLEATDGERRVTSVGKLAVLR